MAHYEKYHISDVKKLLEHDNRKNTDERENVDTRYDKAGASTTNIDESIYILAEGYTESLEIAEMVIAALDRKKASYKGFEVIDATLNDVPETYVSQTYVQQVRMRFTIKEN